mmetsp:Transcript_9171/g.18370  ORF Transcript_9171/g.18370 Transcript_9171/m.18370 type:complete len:478 (-) Transcript_9171:68-1501(-)
MPWVRSNSLPGGKVPPSLDNSPMTPPSRLSRRHTNAISPFPVPSAPANTPSTIPDEGSDPNLSESPNSSTSSQQNQNQNQNLLTPPVFRLQPSSALPSAGFPSTSTFDSSQFASQSSLLGLGLDYDSHASLSSLMQSPTIAVQPQLQARYQPQYRQLIRSKSSPSLRPSSPRPRSSSHGSNPFDTSYRSLTPVPHNLRPWYLIPADSPYKAIWDVSTVLLTLYSLFLTHSHISTRNHGVTESGALVELWFVVDILLNFFTEYKSMDGNVNSDHYSAAKQYLRTWFIVDALSTVPWELWFLQPIIDSQNARGVVKKTFFRSKGVLKVTRVLRGRHFKLLGKISSRTAKFGVGTSRIVKGLIKYLPKYIQFVKRMKFVLPVRLVRVWHSWYKMGKNFVKVQRHRFRRRRMERVDSLGSIREEDGVEDDDNYDDVDIIGTTGVFEAGGAEPVRDGGGEFMPRKPAGIERRHTVANVRRAE